MKRTPVKALRGRPPGAAGTNLHWLRGFAVGERRYTETTLDDYPTAMRIAICSRARRAVALDGLTFSANLFTAVGVKPGDVRYLLCVERIT